MLALGGNALGSGREREKFQEQALHIANAARRIAGIVAKHNVVITHGNGPQVGLEVLRNEYAKRLPRLPLPTLVAETQASIGSCLATALKRELHKNKTDKEVVCVLTHVLVNRNDSAFKRPTKPIGPFYSAKQLRDELRIERFAYVKEERGYRRVVASPKPLALLESGVIGELAAQGKVVIACGGGGIPVIKKNNGYEPINAVVDKDLASQLLANAIGADHLVILTNVDYLYANQKLSHPMAKARATRLEQLIDTFEEGTIKPKVSACIEFVRNGGTAAYIGNLSKAERVISRKSGTEILG